MSHSCELHFQEGFAGDMVTLEIDGKASARFEARTRPQIGLARIETLRLEAGQSVAITVPGKGLKAEYCVDEGDRWITINIVGRSLVLRPAREEPGYL